MSELMIAEWRPETLDGRALEQELEMLAEVLHASVHAGASISFVLPFSVDDARAFLREKVLPSVRAGTRRLTVAACRTPRHPWDTRSPLCVGLVLD